MKGKVATRSKATRATRANGAKGGVPKKAKLVPGATASALLLLSCSSLDMQRHACLDGHETSTDELPPAYIELEKKSKPMPHTNSGDWLSLHKETGQTLQEFKNNTSFGPSSGRKTVIILQPIDFKQDDAFVQKIAKFVSLSLGGIEILPQLGLRLGAEESPSKGTSNAERYHFRSLEHGSVCFREAIKNGHLQARCSDIRDIMSKVQRQVQSSKGGQYTVLVLAITSLDLFEADSDLFLAGFSWWNRGIAVFSCARYHVGLKYGADFWYQIQPIAELDENKSEFLKRICRTKFCTCFSLSTAFIGIVS
jgi:hypothetical protein